ncbi:MAG: hypothetical protein H7125_10590 [Proteobacteria bacterium]|nr:hypothetical protein [Burkholderiales bacterium]
MDYNSMLSGLFVISFVGLFALAIGFWFRGRKRGELLDDPQRVRRDSAQPNQRPRS